MSERTPSQELPTSLRRTPQLERWLQVGERAVQITSGKVEIGQGIHSALILIAAGELGLAPERIEISAPVTGVAPEEGVTAGSQSIEDSGAAIRQVCAWALRDVLARAAGVLGADAGTLNMDESGVITARGLNRTASLWDLCADEPLRRTITSLAPERQAVPGTLVRERLPRRDGPAKLNGSFQFVHDLTWPNKRHARVVRGTGTNYVLANREQLLAHLDTTATNAATDNGALRVHANGDFVVVLGAEEHEVIATAERLENQLEWRRVYELDARPVAAVLKDRAGSPLPLDEHGVPGEGDASVPGQPDNTTRLEAEYVKPFTMHASIGPSAAAALYQPNLKGQPHLVVWSPSQGIGLLRATVARVAGLDPAQVTVIYTQGSGCYGHNGADDVSVDAALSALASPDVPVLLKWTRAQEHLFEPYGPAMNVRLCADLDASGGIQTWYHEALSFPHVGRPIPGGEGVDVVAAWALAEPFAANPPVPRKAPEAGVHRNARPIYDFPETRIVKTLAAPSPLRTSALRSLGAFCNVFAIESFMDELADAAGESPAEFRRRYLEHDDRALAVLNKALALSGGLQPGPSTSVDRVSIAGDLVMGRGLGLARYKHRQCCAAVVAEVAVDLDAATVAVRSLWIAADAGRVIDADGLINQLEGGAIQAVSWTTREAVRYDANGVTSVDWKTYPILRFSEVPVVETALVDYPSEPAVGAGEASLGPTAAAIGNAVNQATGLRIRQLPMDADRLRKEAAR